jgi:riboflavin kinase/FMN adenylyltransferase
VNVVNGLEAFRPSGRPVLAALGTFDGLHRGHRAVIDRLRQEAARVGGEAVALTFDPHPLVVIAPPAEPFLLSTLDERVELFAAAGVDTLVVVRFDQALRELSASAWLDRLHAGLGVRHLVVSSGHAFGRNRQGSPALLEAWARERGVGLTVVAPVRDGDDVVSSSGIRALLRAGDVRTAATRLGRWYTVRGPVVPGSRRGRLLGMPTANVQVPPPKVVPGHGVYAAYGTVEGTTHRAAVNVGVRPTFDDGALAVEAHLLGVDRDLYGRILEVAFVHRLRDEVRFPSAETLKAQMAEDLVAASGILEEATNVFQRPDRAQES